MAELDLRGKFKYIIHWAGLYVIEEPRFRKLRTGEKQRNEIGNQITMGKCRELGKKNLGEEKNDVQRSGGRNLIRIVLYRVQ